MDRHIKEYYRQSSEGGPQGSFHSVIALHDARDISWKEITAKMPSLEKGWYELSRLSIKDRIDFTHDFWLSKLPYRAGLDEFIDRFFSSLDDIGILITQKKFEDLFEAHMVYSLKGNNGFFRGMLPMTEKHQMQLVKAFPGLTLPNDYISFLQIHDGFCKTTDCTGLTSSTDVIDNFNKLQLLIQENSLLETSKGATIDPGMLIPFYESFGMPFFQCFWGEWYPEGEMGNVYYSGQTNTISDIYSSVSSSESMAFPTFTDWLIFYLERIE